jgi:hypothetical protein
MIPSLGAIMMTDAAGSASYQGLQATLDKRLSHGWQGGLSYTWSHSLDTCLNWPEAREHVDPGPAQPSGDRGNSGSTGGIDW